MKIFFIIHSDKLGMRDAQKIGEPRVENPSFSLKALWEDTTSEILA
jgi:hypothetical protein